ncbi:MAG TPA: hypothetical protein VGF48_11725 [Thermoanaerobaculia bacterium]
MTGFDKASQPRDLKLFTARALSVGLHPFVLTPLVVALTSRSWPQTILIAGLTTIPLLILIRRNVRRGTWTDTDVSHRGQRKSLYYAAAPLLLLTGLVLYAIGASANLLRGFFAATAMIVTGFLLMPLLKVSLHMTFAGFSAMILLDRSGFAPPPLGVAILLVLALAWSRRTLDRHTWAEIATGIVIGTAAGAWTVVGG